MLIVSYLKHQSNVIKSSCVISELTFNSIVMIFLYISIYIVCDSYKYLDFFVMFSISRFSFHYLLIIKYNLTLYLISKVLVLKKPLFMLINTFSIVSFFRFDLHFVFKKPLIFFISIVVIVLISSLFISVIISFFPINILMIVDIMFFVKYNTHNSIDLLILSIDFLCLKYHLDKSLLNSYIRHSSS